MSSTLEMAKQAKEAAREFCTATEDQRNLVLKKIAQQLRRMSKEILAANAEDLLQGRILNLNASLLDRLTLTPERIEAMAKTAEEIAGQGQVVGTIVEENKLTNGLSVKRQRIPLGVIAMIFESRPNVVIDSSCLAIKSGNAVILKGGKEALNSNKILCQIVRDCLKGILPIYLVQLVESKDAVAELITMVGFIDVVIPRGGEGLVSSIYQNSKVPVIAHFKGLCHIYLHEDADQEIATRITLNAKVSRPGVCNAMECLLIHQSLPPAFIKSLLQNFISEGVEIRGCEKSKKLLPQITLAADKDFRTEYLDKILSVKIVDSLEEAISHIQRFGTHHTEGICAKDPQAIAKFQQQVDASCIMLNTSTRFNDGGELGLGAELGISTSKLHAYGPMGAREMTTTRFLVESQGKTRP